MVTAPHKATNTRASMKRVTLPLCFRGTQQATGIATLSLPLFTPSDGCPFLFSSLPPPKVQQIWEQAVKGVVPFAAAVQPPLPSCHPCLPSAGCGQQPWGGQLPAVPGAYFPWGRPASFHTSLKLFPNFQAGWEALQPKHPGDVATGHFVI